MIKKQTKNYKFPAKFTPGCWLNISEYLAEKICERLAQKHNYKLSAGCFESDPWKKTFNQQTFIATSLLKIYSEQAILNALNRFETAKIYSLGASFILDPIIKQEELKLKRKPVRQEIPVEEVSLPDNTRATFTTKKSLRSLDG